MRPRNIFLVGLLLLLALCGCNRKPQLVPRDGDSTDVGPSDPREIQVRTARQAWEAPDSGAVAARLTAAIVLDDLNARVLIEPRLDWAARARYLLDSLDVGAEVASAPCALVVNFFDRGDPSAGSWPWAFTCGETQLRASAIGGQGLALQSVATRGLYGEPAKPPGERGVAVLYARRGSSGPQPLLMVLAPNRKDAWDLKQTLGPDSLGGAGTGAFETPGDSTVDLVTRTFGATPHFEECATCPHVHRVHRFRWHGDRFVRIEDQTVPTPYAAFTEFIHALRVGDLAGSGARVSELRLIDDALRAEWAVNRGAWRAAPASDPSAREIVFFRGPTEAWKVRFQSRGGEWVISGFEPTTRSVE